MQGQQMYEYWDEFFTILVIHNLSLMSPGPDFAIVSRNSLTATRKTGLFTALGITVGLTMHIFYCLVGIGILISQSKTIFTLIQYAGAAYLCFLGCKGLLSKPMQGESSSPIHKESISNIAAFRQGLLTNILNPKCTVFFLSVLSVMISPSTPTWVQGVYAIGMLGSTFIWFSFVAWLFSNPLLQKKLESKKHWIDRSIGSFLILLSLYLLKNIINI
jgi:RhtB (resistance to homoserine/threonine) family protein